MTAFLLFISTYLVVMLLGFESQIVRDKHKAWAFFTSLSIGSAQLISFKLAPNANTVESIMFVLGGACGIVSSIYLHNFWLRVVKKEKVVKTERSSIWQLRGN